MLKELFEAHFYSLYDKKKDQLLMLDEFTKSGDFTLGDPTACQGCHYICSDNPAAREQLKVHSTHLVSILRLDQVFGYITEDVGEKCDYLLDGDNFSMLIEMTCSSTDYVKQKRLKARSQLMNTLYLLHANPLIWDHFEPKSQRYAVFSWKQTFPDNSVMDDIEKSMKGMTLMTDDVYSPDNESIFDFGFKLREIRYPDVLVCS